MEQVLATFGIDWKLLLINAVNFGVLMFVLWYFLYEPLLKMLRDRQEKIAQGLEDAENAKRELEQIEHSRAAALAKAGAEADDIVSRARDAGRRKQEELVASGEARAESIVEEASAAASELKNRAVEESKQEVAKLIVLGMEKAFNRKI